VTLFESGVLFFDEGDLLFGQFDLTCGVFLLQRQPPFITTSKVVFNKNLLNGNVGYGNPFGFEQSFQSITSPSRVF